MNKRDRAIMLEEFESEFGEDFRLVIAQEGARDSVIQGYCIKCQTFPGIEVEMDQNMGWCPVCEKNTVKSPAYLLGYI